MNNARPFFLQVLFVFHLLVGKGDWKWCFFLLCFLIASTYQLRWNFTRSDAMKLMQFVASRRDGISR